jgi:hypothetical protein
MSCPATACHLRQEMKAKPGKKKKVAAFVRRKPFDKVEEQTKIKIVEEIKTGMISCLGASRKYLMARTYSEKDSGQNDHNLKEKSNQEKTLQKYPSA